MSTTLEHQAAAGAARTGRRSAAAKATAAEGNGGANPGEGLALDGSGALGALLPLHAAFQLLVAPSLSHGIGLRLKRAGSHPAHRAAHDGLVLGRAAFERGMHTGKGSGTAGAAVHRQ